MRVAELLRTGHRDGPALDRAVDEADNADIAAVLGLATDDDPDLRLAVAQTLALLGHGEPPTTEMLETATALTTDADASVRGWACFVLGQQWIEVDTDVLREALAARLDDEDREAQCEALLGLAYRRDPRALPHVQQALARSSGELWRLELLAAGALSDPRLHDLVLEHQTGWDDDGDPRAVAGLVRRLTDPAGVGEDVIEGVAELCRRRAAGQSDGENVPYWQMMSDMIEIAPHRAAEFFALVLSRLDGDDAATAELRTNSALAQVAGRRR